MSCKWCSEPHDDLDLSDIARRIRDDSVSAVTRNNHVQFFDDAGEAICRPLTPWLVHVTLTFDGNEELAGLDQLAQQ